MIYLPWSNLSRCTFLLFNMLSDRYGNLFRFSMLIMIFLLIKDAYLHIPIVSIIITFLNLFDKVNLTNGKFCHLGGPQFLEFSLLSLNPYCSFVGTWVFTLFFLWMIFEIENAISRGDSLSDLAIYALHTTKTASIFL